jgi:hypothetical protein
MQKVTNFDFSRARTPAQIDDWARHYRVELKHKRVFAKLHPHSTPHKIKRVDAAFYHDMNVLEKKRRAVKTLMKTFN